MNRNSTAVLVASLLAACVLILSAACRSDAALPSQVRGICLLAPVPGDYAVFKRMVSEVLPRYGCNTLVLLMRYRYEFTSHPEVRDWAPVTATFARELATLCRQKGITLVPKMNLLGHQSWDWELDGLLRSHRDFDEQPTVPTEGYLGCRSLCPRHPEMKGFVFGLMDELISAFGADVFHVGCDEVFVLGKCPRCKGTPNYDLFAEWVNALHAHLQSKNVQMMMWGDRLLNRATTGYDGCESSGNDTWQAIDKVPKSIVICDWHYNAQADYPSLRVFSDKGFRVIACPWRVLNATKAFVNFALANPVATFAGVMQTDWYDGGAAARYLVNNDQSVQAEIKAECESFKWAMTAYPVAVGTDWRPARGRTPGVRPVYDIVTPFSLRGQSVDPDGANAAGLYLAAPAHVLQPYVRVGWGRWMAYGMW